MVIALFGIALAVRILFLFHLRESPYFDNMIVDAASYDQWAQRIAAGDVWGSRVFYQSPLYPYFLGLVYSIVGHDYFAARLIQAVIGAGNVALLCVLSMRLFSPRAGLLAGLIAALYATLIFQDLMLLKSVIVIFFLLLSFLFLERAFTRDSRKLLLVSGALYGIAICGRGNLLFAVPLFLIWLVVRTRTGASSQARVLVAPAIIFMLGTALAVAPVTLRNKIIGDDWVLVESDAGINLYVGNHAGATGVHQPPKYVRTVPKHEESDARRYAEQEMGRTLKPSEVSQFWIGQAISYVRSDPVGEAKLVIRKFLLAWDPYEVPDNYNQYYFSRYSWLFRGYLPSFFIVAPFAVIGMLASVGSWRRTGFLHLYVVAYFVSMLVLYVTSRYRLPIMVGLIPFAGHGIVETLRAFRTRGWPSVFKPAAIFVAVTLLGSFTPIDKPGFAKQGSEVAEFYARRGNYTAADRALQTAIDEAGPTELHLVYLNQGIFYSNIGRLEESIQSLEKSLAAQPSFEQAQVKLEQVRSRISERRPVTNESVFGT